MALKEVAIYLLFGSVLLTTTTTHASTEYNQYVKQIFRKYGSGGTISFEVKTKGFYLVYLSLVYLNNPQCKLALRWLQHLQTFLPNCQMFCF